jgi:hypothetical protein
MFAYQQVDPGRNQMIAKIPIAIGAHTSACTGQAGMHNRS